MDAGEFLLTIILAGGFIWFALSFPRALKIIGLIMWGVVVVAFTIFSTFICLSEGKYITALLAFGVGAGLFTPWCKFAYPMLREEFGGPRADF